MADLEAEIRRATKNGLLTISLSKDWSGPNWTSTFRSTDTLKVQEVSSPDPVEALLKALRAGVRDGEAESRQSKSKRQRVADDLA